VGSLRTSA